MTLSHNSIPADQTDAITEQQSDTRKWMNSREAAKYVGSDRSYGFKTLERYAREGKIPGYFCFNRWHFLKEELDAWLKAGVCFSSQSVREN